MDVNIAFIRAEKIRGFLVFFCMLLLPGCREDPLTETLGVRYEDGRAIAVSFMADPDEGPYKIYVSGETNTAVLGTIKRDKYIHTFIPAIPFSVGANYIIRNGRDSIAGFNIAPMDDNFEPPKLIAIHPLRDTVPENLLKCYLQFSEPMQAVGRALNFVKVTELESGEEVAVFLDLDAELWNKDHNRLTLWLDPGRIKTDLIPNRNQGIPIHSGHKYRIEISGRWRSAKGVPLGRDYYKIFYVGEAIREKLNPAKWELNLPATGTREELEVLFDRPPDLLMAVDGSRIRNSKGKSLEGEWKVSASYEEIQFIPLNNWKIGEYELLIDSSLEDLAGNTVNRLFDTNLQSDEVGSTTGNEIIIPFALND